MVHDDPEVALTALIGLLAEFRRGRIFNEPAERDGIDRYTGALSAQWDRRFPGFPIDCFPFASFRGEHLRGRRDRHLKDIVVQLLGGREGGDVTIVNPACVFGRHACELASRLGGLEVICTDIDPNWFRVYQCLRLRHLRSYFKFVRDNVFDPQLDVKPSAVVFFGACGSLSDGAIDYAIRSRSACLACRTCCHDNIGGNTEIVRRATFVNRFFRFKNWVYERMRQKARYAGFYFSSEYNRTAYPRSTAARGASTPDEFEAVARHSVDSDICRTIIDLDRYLHLVENGYSVWYRGELFVAERGSTTAGNAVV